MSRRALTNTAVAAGVLLALGAAPAAAQQGTTAADRDRQTTGATSADEKARAATSSTGEKITDAWILTKVKAQFVGEDALENSDINVDVRNNVVMLKGTVASQAGKARAVAIARATEGVTRVQDNLRVGVAAKRTEQDSTVAPGAAPVAGDVRDETRAARGSAREAGDDMKDAAHDAKKNTKAAAHDTKQAATDAAAETRAETREARENARENAHEAGKDAKDTARNAGRETREATGTAGQAVNDGWITTKVKSSFVGVDALDGSDINVDTNAHVVTLRGTVASAAARARAVDLAKKVEGVKSVKDELTIAPKK
jgi:hyperosmotically inducible periplasmic protein